jgi:Protein of unknown function (DUF2782)
MRRMKPLLVLALVCVCAPCWSQPAPSPAATPARPGVRVEEQRNERGEPNVRHTVIEDDGSKIDEVRVRGQVTHVVVTPKVGVTKPYEIIQGRNGREPQGGTGGADSAVGKRVWNVLAF